MSIPIIRSGFVNSLLIDSPVRVAEDILLKREDMIFMGEDILIVIDPPSHVEEGSAARLRTDHIRGSKPEDRSNFLDRSILKI